MGRLLPLALALSLAAAPAVAGGGPSTRVLAADGGIYAVTQGRYGELFPDGSETAADDPVLAITVIHPDGSAETLLVPATAGPTVEELASLALGPDGETLHVLWQSSAAGSSLRLASLGPGGWAEVVDVSRAVSVLRGSPRAVVTRDRLELPVGGTGATAQAHRSVLHVLWLEEDGGAVIYAPLVVEDGAYIGDHELFALDRLLPSGIASGAPPPAPSSATTPALERGDDRGAAVAAFPIPGTDLLVGVELRMIDSELSRLGDSLRDRILDLARVLEPGSPASLGALAGGARSHLLEAGGGLQPALVELLATEIERYILATGSDWAFQPATMVERTRLKLVELGAEFDHTPVSRTQGPARPNMINVGQRSEAPIVSHDLRLRVTAVRPVPALPEGTTGSVFLSGDAADALIAWERDGVVFFRESDDAAESGWGPVRSLGIEAGDDDLIHGLLTDRVRGR